MTEDACSPAASAALARRRRPGVIPWNEIRAVYEGSDIPLETLAAAYGIRPTDIYPHAEKEGWTLRRKRWALERKARRARTGRPARSRDRGVLIGRLFDAVARQIGEIERRAETTENVPDEKDARALGALARTLETLIAMEKAEATPDSEPRGDIDEFRRELARRIEGLRHGG